MPLFERYATDYSSSSIQCCQMTNGFGSQHMLEWFVAAAKFGMTLLKSIAKYQHYRWLSKFVSASLAHSFDANSVIRANNAHPDSFDADNAKLDCIDFWDCTR
ncbi:unnamed protein product [Phytophthora lilii]|uniref:Unnamed protein product n=1 Tax=Phytophthora lilii TaxID=2077276 RepID=A0A9W6XBI4_9STRA|nr:unnamed protein product [Phytophthora lilii]